MKSLLYLLFLSGLAVTVPALTQESGETEESTPVAEPPAGPGVAGETADALEADSGENEEEEDGELPDDSDLDEQTYEEDEDEFVPTEEIPSGEPIPFPTNI